MKPTLTQEQIENIVEMTRCGLSNREVARRTGIPKSTVQYHAQKNGATVMRIAPVNKLRKDDIIWMSTRRCIAHSQPYLIHYNCYLDEQQGVAERVGFFDIEATNLQATFGYMLSYCIKELDGETLYGVVTPEEIHSGVFDRNIMQKCLDDIRKFDRIVTYYGSNNRFDVPFIRTRAIYHGLDFPVWKELKTTDVYTWVKYRLRLHRNRLETACDFFGIPSKGHRLQPDIWIKALAGNQEAISYILEHNKEDVESLEALWKRLRHLCNEPGTSM